MNRLAAPRSGGECKGKMPQHGGTEKIRSGTEKTVARDRDHERAGRPFFVARSVSEGDKKCLPRSRYNQDMPEPNPYEPPQSELHQASSEKSRATLGTMLGRYLVPILLGVQIAAGILAWLFDFMQAMAHSNYQRLQTIAAIFGFSFLGLGLLLIMLALWRGSLKLLIGEVLALAMFLWLTLPEIH